MRWLATADAGYRMVRAKVCSALWVTHRVRAQQPTRLAEVHRHFDLMQLRQPAGPGGDLASIAEVLPD